MSQKDLGRYRELTKVHEKRQTIAQTADILGISARQVKRLSKRLRAEGPKGLISLRAGKASNHQLLAGLKELAGAIIREQYGDFGPTLAHEYLSERDGLKISVSSVRNLMIEQGIWSSRKKRNTRIFQLRPRRPQEGELIQVDGSEHDWFEGRGPYCTLLAYIDDATGKTMILRFARSENLFDYFEATRQYIKQHGRPKALYPDKHSVFRVNREGALGGTGMTQFGRAMRELDIQLICANTPQAKGRVERRHRDLQDRLIKALRLHNVSSIEEANAFLPSFIEDFNRRFAKVPQDPINAHRPLLPEHDLDRIFSSKTPRQLSKNLMLQYNNVIYQIISKRPVYAMRKSTVMVLEDKDGNITIEQNGQKLVAVPYHQMQAQADIVSAKELNSALAQQQPPEKYRPHRRHPWKCHRRGFSRRHLVSV